MKKTIRKVLALLLTAAMLVPMLCTGAFAEDGYQPDSGAEYTTVFVHGLLGWGDEDEINKLLPYWGLTSGDMPKYMRSMGYDVYVATVGPVSSAWDRCCELFAQLTGTRVDYGQAHADRCSAEYADLGYSLQHSRYGRDYTGNAKIANWGPQYDENGKVIGWYDNKINLVGHSFGGPTAVRFLQLLAEGDEAEREWGMATYGDDWKDHVSPLFWGDYDGEFLINSITSLAGVLNGTTFISANRSETDMLTELCILLANCIGISNFCSIYDFQLEQFGLTNVPGQEPEAYFSYLNRKGFIAGSDQAWYDLSIEGCNKLKQGWETYANVYYFSYSGDKTFQTWLTGAHLPELGMMIMFPIFSAKIGTYLNKNEFVDTVYGTRYGCIDKNWLPNDGLVNSISARYPFGAANMAYDPDNIVPGVWTVHPDLDFDHLGFNGGLFNALPSTTRELFSAIMSDIAKTYPIFPDQFVSDELCVEAALAEREEAAAAMELTEEERFALDKALTDSFSGLSDKDITASYQVVD